MFVFILVLSGLGANGSREEQDRTLASIAQAAAAALGRGDAPPSAFRPLVVTELAASTEPFLLVLAPDGTVRFASGHLNGAPPRIPAAVIVEADEHGRSVATVAAPGLAPRGGSQVEGLRVVAVRWASSSERGIVVAGQSTAFVADQVAGLRLFLLISAIVTLIVVAIVSWLVAGRAVRPLATLAETTSAIATTGDHSRRIALGPSSDEVGRLSTSFNAMLERLGSAQAGLTAALAAQQRLVADASHELRTPLSTIRSNAEFLRARPDATEDDRAAAIADIATETERMSRLVEGLLVLARADAGVASELRPVDIRSIADEEVRRIRPPRLGRDTAPDIRVIADGAALVLGDADALGRAIRVLLDNAFRHGAAPVEVRVAHRDGRVHVEVCDAGPGIPAEIEERVFERFYRADPARSGEGTGLGLSIARAIVEQHGGAIRVTRAEAGGAAAIIELPAL